MFDDIERFKFETIDSTNTWAKQNINRLNPDKVNLITADEQTKGRGRFDRKWLSPTKSNIYATVCFSFLKNFNPNIALMFSITVLEALLKIDHALSLKIKWPNDLILNNKKLGGILIETVSTDRLWIIIGLGLNLNMDSEVLESIDQPATSLMVETGQSYVIEDCLNIIIKQFIQNLSIYQQYGFTPFVEKYKSFLSFKPMDEIKCIQGSQTIHGKYHSLNDDGTLNLLKHDGQIIKIASGEIF